MNIGYRIDVSVCHIEGDRKSFEIAELTEAELVAKIEKAMSVVPFKDGMTKMVLAAEETTAEFIRSKEDLMTKIRTIRVEVFLEIKKDSRSVERESLRLVRLFP